MDNSQARLKTSESQRLMDMPDHDQRYFSITLIKCRILRKLCSLGFLQAGGEDTPPLGDIESVPDSLTNSKFSNLLAIPGVYVPMSPEISSVGKKGWLENERSYGKPMACLRIDQEDHVRHFSAAWDHLELVKSLLSDLFDFPGEYVTMSPEIVCAVSAGEKIGLEESLRSYYGKPMACSVLKTEQGDSVLHLAAFYGRLELVKSIVSDCPCLLLMPNSRDQLPLHVAAYAGHVDIVEAMVATLTFVSSALSEEEKECLNLYIKKDINGDTPLLLSLKANHIKIAACLVKKNQEASFLANKGGISPLYVAVEAGNVSFVKAMLKTTDNDRLEGRNCNLVSHLEGRKYLVHAALTAKNTDVIDVILDEYPSLMDERDENGMTCLSFGASIGFYDGVCKLLDRSTKSVYTCNEDGSYPIHIAVEKGHTRILKVILKRCPDSKYLLNKKGQNILHIAAKSGKASTFLFLYFWKNHLTEKQDMDGNTPLHLATINLRPRTIFYLSWFDKKKCMNTRNSSGLRALDIAEANLQSNYIFRERMTLMVLFDFYASSLDRQILSKMNKRKKDPPAGDKSKDYVNILLVVAALVATVTFAAAFTLPAMQSSIVTIATLIWAQLGDPALVPRSLNVALLGLFFSLLCMSAAFYCGVYVAFAHVKGIVIFLNVTCSVFLFLMLFLLGPHVSLHIPGISFLLGPYFMLCLLLVDENNDEQASAAKISSTDLIQKKQ